MADGLHTPDGAGGELGVLCSGHSKASGEKKNTNKQNKTFVDKRELCLKSWTSITLKTVSELVPWSEGRIHGK